MPDVGWDEDYHSLRQEVGAVWVPRDVVRTAGPEAVSYLQGQLSQDVEGLPLGESAESLLLSPQGKIDALVRVTRTADDELLVAPGDRRIKVRGVQVHGVRQAEAVAGQRAALNLSGVDVDRVDRGQTLVSDDAAEQTRIADAVVEVLPDAKPIKHASRVRFHQGTAEVQIGRAHV